MNVGQRRKMLMNFPQKAVLERLTKYLVFLEFNSPIIKRSNGLLSGFKSHSSYSAVGFQWEDTSWNIGVLSSSLLHSSSLLCTSSLPFPHASCSCKVLASIQWTLWWSFHQLHISSFPPLSYCSNLECQNSDLSGSYLHQTFKITFYILEEVFSFDLIAETVNFCEEKLCTISLFQFDVIVLEIIHQTLADIRILILKYTAFLNTSFVFFAWTVIRLKSNIVQCLKFGFAVSVMANLWLLTNFTSTQFLRFSKVFSDDRIIPRIFTLSPICFFNQGFSLKIFFLDLQTQNKILFEVLVINYVSLLIIQVWHKLFNPIHHQPPRGKWVLIKIIMKLFSIFKIHLEDARFWSPVVKISNPLKTFNRRRFRHCPYLQIICIKISHGLILLACLDRDIHPYMDYLLSYMV